MSRQLLYYGHPGLRQKCEPIKEIDDEVRRVCSDLIEVALERNGAGLAAPQIGYFVRIFVARYGEQESEEEHPHLLAEPKIYINPTLSNPSSELRPHEEGCLSLPGIYAEVNRPYSINIEAMDLEGNIFTEEAKCWHAWVLMHENDHLNGMLFIDRMRSHRRKRLEKSLQELKKKYAAQ